MAEVVGRDEHGRVARVEERQRDVDEGLVRTARHHDLGLGPEAMVQGLIMDETVVIHGNCT